MLGFEKAWLQLPERSVRPAATNMLPSPPLLLCRSAARPAATVPRKKPGDPFHPSLIGTRSAAF